LIFNQLELDLNLGFFRLVDFISISSPFYLYPLFATMNPLRLRALAAPLRAVTARRAAFAPVVARRTLVTPTTPAGASVSDKHVEVEEEAGE
jgi:hypothetical protein